MTEKFMVMSPEEYNWERIAIFEDEINLIKNEIIREIVEWDLSRLPEYFFHIPASSSGKYHPEYTLGEGGLVRHTKAAVKIANELFNIYNLDDNRKDVIIASLILHDGLKKGIHESENTLHEHPKLMAEFVSFKWLSIEVFRLVIAGCIESHMGQWTTSKHSDVVLPTPQTECEKFVHLCDYLASRKFIEIKF